MEADGRAGLAGGRDGHARGRGGLRHLGGGLHEGRPGAVEHDLDDGAGSCGGVGGGRAGRGRHRRDHRLRGDAEPGGIRHGGGGLCDRRRDGDRGRGLHGAEGPADLRSGRDGEDGACAGAGRRGGRGRGDLHAPALERFGGADRRRRGDGDDRELGPAAAGVAGAFRAHGCGACGGRHRRAGRCRPGRRHAPDAGRAARGPRRRPGRDARGQGVPP